MEFEAEKMSGVQIDEHGRLKMYGYSRTIQVKIAVPGFHRWKEAPEEVAYLRNYHRHLFNIRVQIDIDDDRELEYFMVQDKLNKMIKDYIVRQEDLTKDYDVDDFLEKTGQVSGEDENVLVINSCEDFAEWLVYKLEKEYGEDRSISCMVSEDDENGSIVANFN